LVTAWAHGWSSPCSLVAAADSAPNIPNTSVLDFVLSALSVRKVLIAAVKDDVVPGQVRHETFKDFVADATVRKGKDEEARCREGFAERIIVWHEVSMQVHYGVRACASDCKLTLVLVDFAIVSRLLCLLDYCIHCFF
jgi:hypothetical protein